MNEGLKMVGWSWSADLEVIDQLEVGIRSLQLDDILGSSTNSQASAPANGRARPLATGHIFGLSPPAQNGDGLVTAELAAHQQSMLDFSSFFTNDTHNSPVATTASAVSTPALFAASTPLFDFDSLLNAPLFGSSPGVGSEGMHVDDSQLDEWTNV